MPASSALRANWTQPSMSGSAAGDMVLVVSTREVSCAVFIATSPPLGSIQWNLRGIATYLRVNETDVPNAFYISHLPSVDQSFLSANDKWKMKTIIRSV